MNKIYVSVYGSLRQGMGNHRVMEFANGKFVGTARIPNLELFAYAGTSFPATAFNDETETQGTLVEVYEVSEKGLRGPLDGLEGYPNFYNRSLIDIPELNLKSWVYHMELDELQGKYELIESGDWVAYREEKLSSKKPRELSYY